MLKSIFFSLSASILLCSGIGRAESPKSKYLFELPQFQGQLINKSPFRMGELDLEFKWDCRKKTLFAHDEGCGNERIKVPTARDGSFTFEKIKRDRRLFGVAKPSAKRRYYGTFRVLSKEVRAMEDLFEVYLRHSDIAFYQLKLCCGEGYTRFPNYSFDDFTKVSQKMTFFYLPSFKVKLDKGLIENIDHHVVWFKRGVRVAGTRLQDRYQMTTWANSKNQEMSVVNENFEIQIPESFLLVPGDHANTKVESVIRMYHGHHNPALEVTSEYVGTDSGLPEVVELSEADRVE